MKVCSKCKIEKNLSEFHERKNGKDEYRHVCKQCISDYGKEYYQKNIIKRRKQNNIWREKNPEWEKKYKNSKANYDTYVLQISYAEKVKNIDGFLQVKCTYCGK